MTQFTNCVSAWQLVGVPVLHLAQSVERIARGWMVRGSNFDGDSIFLNRPNRYTCPHNHLQNGHRVSFPGVKRPGRGVLTQPNLALRLKKE
jgi:hypothetical protein